MSKDFDSLFSDDIDSLFDNDETFTTSVKKANILIIGTIILYRRFKRNVDSELYNIVHVVSIDDAVVDDYPIRLFYRLKHPLAIEEIIAAHPQGAGGQRAHVDGGVFAKNYASRID